MTDFNSIDQSLRKEVEIARINQQNEYNFPATNLFNKESNDFESDGNVSFTSIANSNDLNIFIDANNDNDANNSTCPKSNMYDVNTFIETEDKEVYI